MTARGTLDALVVPVGRALAAVGELLDLDDGAGLLRDLGYAVPDGGDLVTLFSELGDAAGGLAGAVADVVAAYEDGSWEDPSFLPTVTGLADRVVDFARAAAALVDRAETAFSGMQDFLAEAPIDELPRRLLDYLLVGFLRREHPRVAATLELLGAIGETFVPEGEHNPPFRLIEVRWERIATALSDPGSILAEEYGWGTAAFADGLLLDRLNGLLWLFGVVGTRPDERDGTGETDEGNEADLVALPQRQLDLPVHRGTVELAEGLAGIVVGVRLRRAEDAADADNAGLALVPYLDGAAAGEVPVSEGWGLTFVAAVSLEGFSLRLHPKTGPALGAGSAAGQVGLGMARHGDVLGPLVLLGREGASRLAVGDVVLRFTVGVDAHGELDAGVELALGGVALVVSAGDGDGFLAKVLPAEGIGTTFDVTVGWSHRRGLYPTGAEGFAVSLPVQTTFLGVRLDTVDLALATGEAGAVHAVVTVTGGVELGPVKATVDGLGVQAELTFPDGGGNLGPAQLDVGFRPPRGVALAIDSGPVGGGGFLFFDAENEQYAGGIHLELEGLTLNAVGLLTTRMPDGSRGFSLLVIITATGFAPVQLGFGFALTGIGGLLGINRTVAVDVLQAGVRQRSLDAVLLSQEDPTPRAPALVRTLQTVFPPAPGQYVFGPMAVITWGTPPILTLEIAALLELPAPVRLIVVGRLKAVLPPGVDERQALVRLNLDLLGVVDFDRREAAVDATLYDSTVAGFSVSGDMALRASWGATPQFVLSVGGLHPRFAPPPGFPALRRLAIALSSSNNPRLRIEAYFALTPNTVQFGARLDLFVQVDSVSLAGLVSFDTLVQFDPFEIEAEVLGRLVVKVGSTTLLAVEVHLLLTGPAPWRARGEATFRILFLKVSVRFDLRFGSVRPLRRPDPVDIWPVLRAALVDQANWSGELPADGARLVTVRALPATTGGQVPRLHPLASLSIRQRLVPLDRDIARFANAPPLREHRFSVTGARVGGAGRGITPQFDQFAPAQFFDLSETDKLTGPAFDRMPAGVQVQGGTVGGPEHRVTLGFTTLVVEPPGEPRAEPLPDLHRIDPPALARLAATGAAATADLRNAGRAKFAGPAREVQVKDPAYAVVGRDDLRPAAGAPASDGSWSGATEALRRYTAGRPDRAERTQLAPDHETRR